MPLSQTLALFLIEGKVTIDDIVTLLTKYKMLSLLPQIHKAVRKLQISIKDKESIIIESPFSLSEDSVRKIKRIVGNDLANTEVVIKENILSGFKARYKGKLYDGSGERIIQQLLAH